MIVDLASSTLASVVVTELLGVCKRILSGGGTPRSGPEVGKSSSQLIGGFRYRVTELTPVQSAATAMPANLELRASIAPPLTRRYPDRATDDPLAFITGFIEINRIRIKSTSPIL